MFHAVPIFWRLHQVHHTHLDIDVTTGVRFHPAEVVLSMGIKMAVVFLLGAPVLAVLLFEVILNGTSMFSHGNVRMGRNFDRWLRLFLVTRDMHRVHHSVIIRETNSNFGFNFPWWDRLFGTYRAQPANGRDRMVIGLSRYRDPDGTAVKASQYGFIKQTFRELHKKLFTYSRASAMRLC
jgi:sterol desaturase/sphingolipid hydroxylase (fatty acid hydroxylase superfamily)